MTNTMTTLTARQLAACSAIAERGRQLHAELNVLRLAVEHGAAPEALLQLDLLAQQIGNALSLAQAHVLDAVQERSNDD